MLNGGRTFEAQFAPARLGEVQRSALDPTRSARGARASRADVELADGLRRTLQFVAQDAGSRVATTARAVLAFGFGGRRAVAVPLARERVQRLDLPRVARGRGRRVASAARRARPCESAPR